MGKNSFRLILAVLVLAWLLMTLRSSLAATNSGVGVGNQDAIAVRVIPNPNHYSIARWYESQGFQGSPQSLLVDGYEAIRDGRTVYVNAANIDQDTNSIYSNIYLISYNQDPVPNTVDILGQIISHWKFNSNLTDSTSPRCSISALGCDTDLDCPVDSFCVKAGSSSGYANSCQLKTAKYCLVDSDCPANYFCDSLKSKVTRDLKRVGRLEEIKEALANFQKTNNRYPQLNSGSYLSGHSLSVWPSWTQELLTNLAMPQSFQDPINRLGSCPGYDRQTCWSIAAKRFFNNQSAGASQLVLPADSYALAYATDANGSKYNLCAVLESRAPALNYHFSPNDPATSTCSVSGIGGSSGYANNTPPELVSLALTGEVNQEFNGYIQVKDKENNPLVWTLRTSGTSWSGWSAAPVLQNTSSSGQKKVYAARAGAKGTYNINLNVSDGQGGILATTVPIKILSSMISIEADNAEYVANRVDHFKYSFTFSGRNVSASSYTVSCSPFNLLNSLSGLQKTVTLIGTGKYRIEYDGLIPASQQFTRDQDFKCNLQVTDSLGNTAGKSFTITVKATVPLLDFNCAPAGRVDQLYTCELGPFQQENQSLHYTATGLPTGFRLVTDTNQWLKGSSAYTTSANVTVRVTNDYAAAAEKKLSFQINNYCGDGIRQEPNTEGRGGLYNDGYEDCDGLASIAADAASSRIDQQYGCQTTADSARPFPILSNDQCVFKSPTKGGGYCGDGYCQAKINNAAMETCDNCSSDCCQAQITENNCVPNCFGRSCGDDGCGGSCGLCGNSSQSCVDGHCLGARCSSGNDCNDNNPCTNETCSGGQCSYSHNNNYQTACSNGIYYNYPAYSGGELVATFPNNGLCHIIGTKRCSGGYFGNCDTSDPRPGYCTKSDAYVGPNGQTSQIGRCEGENFNTSDLVAEMKINGASQCSGTCVNTGNGTACLSGGNKIKTKSCATLWHNSHFSGDAPCNSDCTGYTTSTPFCVCTPDTCASKGYVCGSGYNNGCDGAPNAGTLYCGPTSTTVACTYGTCYGTKKQSCTASGKWVDASSCSAQPTCPSLGYVCGTKNNNGCGGTINCGADTKTRACTVSGSGGYNGYYTDNCVNGVWVEGKICSPSTKTK
ncbi:MAG: hypothetical protein WC453_01495 [Patescibacteria group bacterium]